MQLESSEVLAENTSFSFNGANLSLDEMSATFSSYSNSLNSSVCSSSLHLSTDDVPEQLQKRRRSSRPANNKHKPLKQHAKKPDPTTNLILEEIGERRPHTPTELISGITSFTFSNFFTPVDKENSPLPNLNFADSEEVWEIMLQKDRDYKRDPLYIRKHPQLQPRMRAVLLDWLIEVCEVYRLHRETFHLAVDFVDRYLSSQKNIQKTRLQLVGITALFVA
jgi:hypothetical protein